jgi:hypothetical protein
MTAYKVITESVRIHSGVLVLSLAQAAARMHRLTALGDNRYDVRDGPVMFKRGEVFELEVELPKAMVQSVDEAEGFAKVEPVKEKPDKGKWKGPR